MERINETQKIDLALVPQTINNTNVTGRYFSMRDYRAALAVMNVGAAAATKTVKLELFEATDADGTGGQLITGATATITANTAVTKATVALATVLAGHTVTINGVTFTAHSSTTTAANREFSIGGTDTADGDELESLINDSDYGVPGVTASNASGTLTLTVDDPGSRTLTITASNATFTIATTEAVAYVEIDHDAITDGFTHIAAKVTSTANGIVGVTLLRGSPRDTVAQYVGASATV